MDKELRQSIISTLAYMDQFEHPLTPFELYRWLWKYSGNLSFDGFLEALSDSHGVEEQGGYLFLSGRSSIIEKREERVSLVEKKMKIARRAAKVLRYIPFIRAVFVCNTVSMGLVTKESDIDVLVVTAPRRIWMARFFSNIFLKLFRLRTGKYTHADKVCLSFFVTEEHLDFSSLQQGTPDIYLLFWIDQLIPFFDPHQLHKTIRGKNMWVRDYLPHALKPYDMAKRWLVDHSFFSKKIQRFFEVLWGTSFADYIEGEVEGLQRHKFSFRKLKEQGTNIIINNSMIKLHEHDRRAQYRDEWKRILQLYV